MPENFMKATGTTEACYEKYNDINFLMARGGAETRAGSLFFDRTRRNAHEGKRAFVVN
jgi:virulence-associated protein VapD